MAKRNLTSYPQIADQELMSSSSTKRHNFGDRFVTGDGRTVVYCKAGAVALVAGNAIQAAAEIANHQALTPAAAAIGATSITVALGATAATANQYADGWAVITVTPGEGYTYPISSHPAANLSTSVVLQLMYPIQVALTTSSRVTLVANPYNGVIQAPITTLTGALVGVCQYPLAIGEYGFLGIGGVWSTLTAGTTGPGLMVGMPGPAAGQVTVNPANVAGFVDVGSLMHTATDGGLGAVNWMLD